MLIVELTALVLTLARQSALVDFWTDLARTSLFLLWIGLAGAALLCFAARPARTPHRRARLRGGAGADLARWWRASRSVRYLVGRTPDG